jgi:hypothetical protein
MASPPSVLANRGNFWWESTGSRFCTNDLNIDKTVIYELPLRIFGGAPAIGTQRAFLEESLEDNRKPDFGAKHNLACNGRLLLLF